MNDALITGAIATICGILGAGVKWGWDVWQKVHQIRTEERKDVTGEYQVILERERGSFRDSLEHERVAAQEAVTRLTGRVQDYWDYIQQQGLRHDQEVQRLSDHLGRERLEKQEILGRLQLAQLANFQLRGGVDPNLMSENWVDVAIGADEQGRINVVSPAIHFLLHWTPQELVGKSLDMLIPEEWRARHWAAFRKVAETGNTPDERLTRAVWAQTKEGEIVPINLKTSAWKGRDGHWQYAAILSRRYDAQAGLAPGLTGAVGSLTGEIPAYPGPGLPVPPSPLGVPLVPAQGPSPTAVPVVVEQPKGGGPPPGPGMVPPPKDAEIPKPPPP